MESTLGPNNLGKDVTIGVFLVKMVLSIFLRCKANKDKLLDISNLIISLSIFKYSQINFV